MNYHELNPPNQSIRIDGKDFELRPFDLTAQSWAYYHFSSDQVKDGMLVLSKRIQDIRDAECYLQVAWHLLIRKEYFQGDYSNFVKTIEKNKEDRWNNLTSIYKSVALTIASSQPNFEDMKDDLEIKKPRAAGLLKKLATLSSMIFSPRDMVIALSNFIRSLLSKFIFSRK